MLNLPLKEHLLENEKIIASAKTTYDGHLYATDQRLIRYYSGFLSEKFDSLPYARVLATCYNKKPKTGDITAGSGLAILGAVFVILFDSISVNLIAQLMLVTVIIGVILVILGILGTERFYEFKAAGLSGSEQVFWRTAEADKEAKVFAKFVQDQIIKMHSNGNSGVALNETLKASDANATLKIN